MVIEAIPIVAIPINALVIVAKPLTLWSPSISKLNSGSNKFIPTKPWLVITISVSLSLDLNSKSWVGLSTLTPIDPSSVTYKVSPTWKSCTGSVTPIPKLPTPVATIISSPNPICKSCNGLSVPIPKLPTPVATIIELPVPICKICNGLVVPIPTLVENTPTPLTSSSWNGAVVPIPTSRLTSTSLSLYTLPKTSNLYSADVVPIPTFLSTALAYRVSVPTPKPTLTLKKLSSIDI